LSTVVDIRWPLALPGRIPLQHQYPLLAALSRVVPSIHDTPELGIHSIRGVVFEPGKIALTQMSSISIRTDIAQIPKLLPLSGKKIDLVGHSIRLGVPHILPLHPFERLTCNFATIKGFLEPDSFSKSLRRQLDDLRVRRSVIIDVGQRRTLQVKQHTIVGFRVTVDGLEDNESIQLQACGAGGRRHLGAGLFLATYGPNHKGCENEFSHEHQAY
jgi:CRISPR-associated endonuclease/helicase Cas3